MSLQDTLAQVYLELRHFAKTNTLDPYSNAAAAIVMPEGRCLAMACNKLARGVSNEAGRWNRPQRYLWVEMAPRAVIYDAVRRGERIAGLWLVATVFPVADDARAIIECGLRGIAAPAPDLTDRLESDYYVSAQRMLFEASVQVEYLAAPAAAGMFGSAG
jgi:deoxycytidylate deaminase